MRANRSVFVRRCVVLVSTIVSPFTAYAQDVPLANEFLVNTYTTQKQDSPAIAADADGDFIVVWASEGQDGSGGGIFGRRFASSGLPLGIEFAVNSYTSNIQSGPFVAAQANGDFIVSWAGPGDGHYLGVFAQRFSSSGSGIGGEFVVNTRFTNVQQQPSLGITPAGDFVITWESKAQDGSEEGIFARRYSSAGVALAVEFQVNTYTTSIQNRPSVGVEDDGDFVIAWSSLGQDGSIGGIFAQRFSSDGLRAGIEFQVNAITSLGQLQAIVGVDENGGFVIAWNGIDALSTPGVFARRYTSAGDSIAPGEFLVNTYTPNGQAGAQVAMNPDGDFVVVWHSDTQDGSSFGIFARAFSSDGAALGAEFQVNTYTLFSQNIPTVARGDAGFVIAWQSPHDEDEAYGGIFAQRFGVATFNLDVDGNGDFDAVTDGVLVVRRLFGLTGDKLILDAIGDGCSNCTADEIIAYISALGLVLDIDGNGSLGALSDGLLALRRLFGFTGNSLVLGAVGAGCSRCTAEEIEPYLAGLLN